MNPPDTPPPPHTDRVAVQPESAFAARADQFWAAAPVAGGPPLPATVGRFRIVRRLGAGGFGVVYLADDPRLGRSVALKVPRLDALLDPDLHDRFLREARAAAALDHPNIVPAYEAGEAGPVCYIASAYCPGPNLAQWLAGRATPVPVADAACLGLALADALAYVHDRGILHRDLKPANILLSAESGVASAESEHTPGTQDMALTTFSPRLSDFGLAKLLGDGGAALTASAAALGTPQYMAPEQADRRAGPVGPATDVYALGAVLFEVLTGRPPFYGASALDVLRQVVERLPLRSLRPDCPRDLAVVVEKCLRKSPAERYATARELADDLSRFLAGEPVRARAVGPVGRAVRWARRRPAMAALVGTAAAALLAALAGSLWHTHALGLALAESDRLRGAGLVREARLRESLYVADLRAAKDAWDNGDLPRVRAILERYRPAGGEADLRGFEWFWLRACCGAESGSLRGGHPKLLCGAVAPDGRTLVTGDRRGGVVVWDLATREPLRAFPAHGDEVNALAYSPDGRTLASGGKDRAVRLWDTRTWSEVGCLRGHTMTVTSVAFAPDRARLATASRDGRIAVWGLPEGRLRRSWTANQDVVQCLAFTPDGGKLVSGGKAGTAKLWDADSGRELAVVTRRTDDVLALAVSPDGRSLATGGYHYWLTVGDLEPAGQFGRTLSPNQIRSLAFSPDGETVASGGAGGALCLWQATRAGVPPPLQKAAHLRAGTLRFVAFLDGGATLLSGSEQDGALQLWDVDLLRGRRSARLHESVNGLFDVTPDGRTVISGDSGGVVSFSEPAARSGRGGQGGHSGLVHAVAVAPSGGTVATAGQDRRVLLWDAASGRITRPLEGHAGPVCGLAYSPDGALLASAADPHTVKLWSTSTGACLGTWEQDSACQSVTFSPDGTCLAVGGDDGTVRVWTLEASPRRVTLTGHAGPVHALAFSPDGSNLVSADDSGAIRVWDWPGGRERGTLIGHTNSIRRLAISPDGKTLASVGVGGALKLWHLPTRRELFALPLIADHNGPLRFTPDGSALFVGEVQADEPSARRWLLRYDAPP
jgi:WD40 repeat protein